MLKTIQLKEGVCMLISLRKMILFVSFLGLLFVSACVQKTQNLSKEAESWRVPVKAGKDEGTVDKEFFKTLIDSRPDNIAIVDVRTPQEFQNGHIKGAINIPVNDIYKDCNLVVSKLPKNKDIIFVCVSGNRSEEIYFGLKEDCKYPEINRLFFLDAHVDYTGGKFEIR